MNAPIRTYFVAFLAAAVATLVGPTGCHSQTVQANALVVEVPESLRSAPQTAALLRVEEVHFPPGEGLIVQVFVVPPGGKADTEMPSEDYLGYFAGEARTGEEAEGSPARNFAVAAPRKLPALIERAGTKPLEVVLVPVDRDGRPKDVAVEVGRVRAAAE